MYVMPALGLGITVLQERAAVAGGTRQKLPSLAPIAAVHVERQA